MREPLWLYIYILSALPIALALFCWRRPRWSWLAGVSGIICALALMLAASRLGWAAALIIVALLMAWSSRLRTPRLIGLGAFTLVTLVSATVLWRREFGTVQEMARYVVNFATFADAEHGEGDLRGRMRLIGILPEALVSSPLIGIGTNNVGFKYYEAMNLDRPRISSTHSTYLDALIETGGIGLAAFLVLLLGAARVAWHGVRRAGIRPEGALFLGLWLGTIGMALHLTSWSGWREAHVWFTLGLAYACHCAFHRAPNT